MCVDELLMMKVAGTQWEEEHLSVASFLLVLSDSQLSKHNCKEGLQLPWEVAFAASPGLQKFPTERQPPE